VAPPSPEAASSQQASAGLPAEIMQCVVIKPGDTLIVRVDPDRLGGDGFAEVEELKRSIVTYLPERTRVIVLGVDEMAIGCPDPKVHDHDQVSDDRVSCPTCGAYGLSNGSPNCPDEWHTTHPKRANIASTGGDHG
jgi:hypothetical protein